VKRRTRRHLGHSNYARKKTMKRISQYSIPESLLFSLELLP
jgi:hypothetical protein